LFVPPQEICIPVLGGIPAVILYKSGVTAQIHRQGGAANRATGNQVRGCFHFPLLFHHVTHGGLIIIGFVVARLGTLPQAVIYLGVEQTAFVKACTPTVPLWTG
ncbi:hypothetical protein, partial [Gemmiger sp.]|uniref:hypothetical protein n=1 Tax=Gemmiger sp. TaxID=2049027 RepID=UPI0039C6AB16